MLIADLLEKPFVVLHNVLFAVHLVLLYITQLPYCTSLALLM
jgi:hypothetical protein